MTRDIVRKSLPPDSVSMVLEYKVMLIDANGNETAVDPHEHRFKIGDEIAVRIKPDDDVYVYVFTKGPTGTLGILLPTKSEEPPRVKKGEEISLPENDFLVFAEPAGEEQLVVVATFEPSDNVRLLARNAFAEQKRAADTLRSDSTDRAAVDSARDNLLAAAATRGVSHRFTAGPRAAPPHVFPPTADEPSNLAVTYAPAGTGKPEMVLTIPLVSRSAAAAPAP